MGVIPANTIRRPLDAHLHPMLEHKHRGWSSIDRMIPGIIKIIMFLAQLPVVYASIPNPHKCLQILGGHHSNTGGGGVIYEINIFILNFR